MTTETRRQLGEAEYEKLLDAALMRRMATDAAYQHAENAEAQSAREDELSDEEARRLASAYQLERCPSCGFTAGWEATEHGQCDGCGFPTTHRES